MFQVKVINSTGSDVEFSCRDNESLLDAARAHAVKIPFGCNGGGCGMCKIKVEEGIYEIGTSSKAVLPDEERVLKYALACKTYPKSNVNISIDAAM